MTARGGSGVPLSSCWEPPSAPSRCPRVGVMFSCCLLGWLDPSRALQNLDKGAGAVGRKGEDPQVLQYSNHSIFWEIILLIFTTQRLCLEPEGVCLIHHACSAHNTRPDKQNILK